MEAYLFWAPGYLNVFSVLNFRGSSSRQPLWVLAKFPPGVGGKLAESGICSQTYLLSSKQEWIEHTVCKEHLWRGIHEHVRLAGMCSLSCSVYSRSAQCPCPGTWGFASRATTCSGWPRRAPVYATIIINYPLCSFLLISCMVGVALAHRGAQIKSKFGEQDSIRLGWVSIRRNRVEATAMIYYHINKSGIYCEAQWKGYDQYTVLTFEMKQRLK